MEPEFWHEKWQNNQTAFHLSAVNPLLVGYFAELALMPGDTIFLPLCGKTLDIAWLRQQGLHVVGVELHEPAVRALFEGLATPYDVVTEGQFIRYETDNITVWVGDFFELSANMLGTVDAIYDRAAIVALPEAMRIRYSQHLITLAKKAKQLVINYEYDQSVMSGPPFSVSNSALHNYYNADYSMTQLYHGAVEGGLKGRCPATENVWLLVPRMIG